MSEENSDSQPDVLSLIPEAYFDLIARVVPGFLVVLALWFYSLSIKYPDVIGTILITMSL
jgi:hypothetical protein